MNQEMFEKKVMEMLLRGDYPVLQELRHQYENAMIENRKFSGAGFFTHFKIKDGIPPMAKKNFEVGDITVSLNNIKNAIGILLFVRNGYLDWLEGYTLVIDNWPSEYSDVVLEYGKAGNRDYKKLEEIWS